MCGRFNVESNLEQIIKSYGIVKVRNRADIKGEIFPGTNIPVILNDKGRTLDFFRWGFQIKGLNKEVINARIETALDKSSFKESLLSNRCIIPANAFFEWETTGKSKLKYKISVDKNNLFSMAGIYDKFIDKNNNSYFGVAILTRASNKEMSKLHHRMPVFISKEQEEKWLSNGNKDIFSLQKELQEDDWMKLDISPADGAKQLTMYDLL